MCLPGSVSDDLTLSSLSRKPCWCHRDTFTVLPSAEAAEVLAVPLLDHVRRQRARAAAAAAERARVADRQRNCHHVRSLPGRSDRLRFVHGWTLGWECLECGFFVQTLPDDHDFRDD